MNRVVKFVFAIIVFLLLTPSASALTVEPTPSELPVSPILITSYQTAGGQLAYVQIFNNSSSLRSLDGWRLEYTSVKGEEEIVAPVTLSGYILPETYVVIASEGGLDGADILFTADSNAEGSALAGVRLIPPDQYIPYVVDGTFNDAIRYDLTKSSAGNYVKSSKFVPVDPATTLYGGGLYEYPETSPLRVVELLANPANCPPLSEAQNCREFIKLYNSSDHVVDAGLFRLRFGWANQSSGVTNTVHLAGEIEAGGYRTVDIRDDGKPLEITASGGSIWLEDIQGIAAYSETVHEYGDIGDTSRKGQSWAVDDQGKWRWAVASPAGANNFDLPAGKGSSGKTASLKPCRSNQYRNPETNRCRSKVAATRTSCKSGQYRNPETNRCKSVSAASASLTPCSAGKERNPETNRCRSVTAASSKLKPCGEGKERNPETNRCRNKKGDVPAAAFSPEQVAKTGEAFTGWWALGGVGALALGRLGWEWREEMRRVIEKVMHVFTGGK